MNGAKLLNPTSMLLRYPMRYPHMQVFNFFTCLFTMLSNQYI